MRQVREVLRLKCVGGVSSREIARRLGVAPSTVRATLKRFASAGLAWPLPDDMSDEALEARLFGNGETKQQPRRRVAEPDWAAIHQELKRKHVTLMILWEEYIEREPAGFRYSRFCELYRSFAGKLSVTMRQTHVGGEKLFVDYAGDTVSVVDRQTGEVREAQIFVAVMGASNFVYAEATWSQTLGDWIGAHTRAFTAIGGVPKLVVPDNAKVAVVKACLYEPQVNRTYTDMASHYGTAILPTRPLRPRDKSKVEGCVLIVERWLIGRLRNRIFHSLADLNQAILEMLQQINEVKTIRRLGKTRRQLLEELDRPALMPLPIDPYMFAEWRLCRVGIDYHIEVAKHFYSVPHCHARCQVDVRLTSRTVEIFLKGKRIAVHVRGSGNHGHTTVPDHMPSSHQRYADWTIDRIRRDAASIGRSTATLCELILERKPHPEQGFRACRGILRLERGFGRDRLEAAASRAIAINALTCQSLRSILENHLDRQPANEPSADGAPVIHHLNIRGSGYYH